MLFAKKLSGVALACLKLFEPTPSPSTWLQANSRKIHLCLSPKDYTVAEMHFCNTTMEQKPGFLVTATFSSWCNSVKSQEFSSVVWVFLKILLQAFDITIELGKLLMILCFNIFRNDHSTCAQCG